MSEFWHVKLCMKEGTSNQIVDHLTECCYKTHAKQTFLVFLHKKSFRCKQICCINTLFHAVYHTGLLLSEHKQPTIFIITRELLSKYLYAAIDSLPTPLLFFYRHPSQHMHIPLLTILHFSLRSNHHFAVANLLWSNNNKLHALISIICMYFFSLALIPCKRENVTTFIHSFYFFCQKYTFITCIMNPWGIGFVGLVC